MRSICPRSDVLRLPLLYTMQNANKAMRRIMVAAGHYANVVCRDTLSVAWAARKITNKQQSHISLLVSNQNIKFIFEKQIIYQNLLRPRIAYTWMLSAEWRMAVGRWFPSFLFICIICVRFYFLLHLACERVSDRARRRRSPNQSFMFSF